MIGNGDFWFGVFVWYLFFWIGEWCGWWLWSGISCFENCIYLLLLCVYLRLYRGVIWDVKMECYYCWFFFFYRNWGVVCRGEWNELVIKLF